MYGKRLHEVRKFLQLTQNELAKKLEINARAYLNYEQGTNKPTFDLLTKLYKTYNVNLNWLIVGEGEMFIKTSTSDSHLKAEVEEILKQHGLI